MKNFIRERNLVYHGLWWLWKSIAEKCAKHMKCIGFHVDVYEAYKALHGILRTKKRNLRDDGKSRINTKRRWGIFCDENVLMFEITTESE